MSAAQDRAEIEDMFDIEQDALRTGLGLVEDPYPVWKELLAQGPVHEGSLGTLTGLQESGTSLFMPGYSYVSVFSFQAVSEVFTRKEDFNSQFYNDMQVNFGDTILGMDGLRHRRYRNLIQSQFQPAVASTWWRDKIITSLVEELVSAFENDEAADLNSQFFARLPMQTVTEGFGFSAEEGREFRKNYLKTQNNFLTAEERAVGLAEADAILTRVIEARQKEQQDDIISKLAVAELEEDDGTKRKLTVEEIRAFCRLIMFAGGGTTWKQLGITLYALLNNPEQLEAVMKDRSLLPQAVLESSRWYPNDPLFPRKAMRDTVLQGIKIPKDTVLHLCLGSANRDPGRWESPDDYDIFRPVQRGLAFAAGAHSCLGQHVAREEMHGALNALFDRFPNLRRDPAYPPAKLTGSLMSRGPGQLRVLLH